jgi:hypothetical protein
MKEKVRTLEQLLLKMQDRGIPGIGPLLRMAKDQQMRPLAWKRRRAREKIRTLAKRRYGREPIVRHVRIRGPRSRQHIERCACLRWRKRICGYPGLHRRSRAGD